METELCKCHFLRWIWFSSQYSLTLYKSRESLDLFLMTWHSRDEISKRSTNIGLSAYLLKTRGKKLGNSVWIHFNKCEKQGKLGYCAVLSIQVCFDTHWLYFPCYSRYIFTSDTLFFSFLVVGHTENAWKEVRVITFIIYSQIIMILYM